jgi:hypothetical protein
MRTLTNTAPDTRDLARRVLAANAVSCLVSGAGMAVLANPLGGWIGGRPWPCSSSVSVSSRGEPCCGSSHGAM